MWTTCTQWQTPDKVSWTSALLFLWSSFSHPRCVSWCFKELNIWESSLWCSQWWTQSLWSSSLPLDLSSWYSSSLEGSWALNSRIRAQLSLKSVWPCSTHLMEIKTSLNSRCQSVNLTLECSCSSSKFFSCPFLQRCSSTSTRWSGEILMLTKGSISLRWRTVSASISLSEVLHWPSSQLTFSWCLWSLQSFTSGIQEQVISFWKCSMESWCWHTAQCQELWLFQWLQSSTSS